MWSEARIVRRFKDQQTKRAVRAGIHAGLRYRVTRNGIIFYGKDGLTAGAHYTPSDHRAGMNFCKRMEQLGVDTSK